MVAHLHKHAYLFKVNHTTPIVCYSNVPYLAAIGSTTEIYGAWLKRGVFYIDDMREYSNIR